jgi:hypothetical protein
MFLDVLPCGRRARETRLLALEIERLVHILDGTAPPPARGGTQATLQAAHTRLDSLVQARRAAAEAPPPEPHATPPSPQPPAVALPPRPSISELDEDAELSPVARVLIRVRDHLAFARMEGSGLSPDVVELVYGELGAALALENVTVLEGDGVFDPEYQQVVELRATADPAQADRVCQTVRAGYSVGGEVVRPQQVVIYARAG